MSTIKEETDYKAVNEDLKGNWKLMKVVERDILELELKDGGVPLRKTIYIMGLPTLEKVREVTKTPTNTTQTTNTTSEKPEYTVKCNRPDCGQTIKFTHKDDKHYPTNMDGTPHRCN